MTARILVVDDVPANVRLLQAKLEAEYYEVLTAANGPEALALAATRQPDIVLLDVMMRRDTEGLEYLPQIKQKLPSAKVIMVTGVEDKETIEAARELGADDYITKPLILEYLENTVMKKIKELGILAAN